MRTACQRGLGEGRKRGILDGGGYRDGEECDLGVIASPVPGFRLGIFIALKSDGSVLAEA